MRPGVSDHGERQQRAAAMRMILAAPAPEKFVSRFPPLLHALRDNFSPSGPLARGSPCCARVRAVTWGVRDRNEGVVLSPNGDFSPKLGTWPI